MSSGRRPKAKGDRCEREFARLVNGDRVPLSGAADGDFSGDVLALGLTALTLKADRKPWLVVLRLDRLLACINGNPHGDA